MANVLGYYEPLFYAQEALIHLQNSLRMASRVHRGYDAERRTFERGEYVNIRKPSTFTAADAPASAVDLAVESVQIQLAYWREVKFKLSDKELSFTGPRQDNPVIRDHILPAAYALGQDIDSKLCDLTYQIPHEVEASSPAVVADITAARADMFNRGVPLVGPAFNHILVDGTLESQLLNLSAFTQQQGAGDQGVSAQMTGSLGTKYGFEIFADQNVPTQDFYTINAVDAVTVNAAAAVGATSVAITRTGWTDGTYMRKGNIISFAGDTQNYVLTADAQESSDVITCSIFPALKVALSGSEAVTINTAFATAAKQNNCAFHRNAFALVMARLPGADMLGDLGARVASVQDANSGLSLRSRVYYVGNSSEVHVALDVLYGVKTLDPNLGCRILDA